MQIILICQYETGGVGLNATRIDGQAVPERQYAIVNHHLLLEGDNESVIHHDVDELLAMGDLYRLPTPAESDAFAEAQRAAASVQESDPAKDASKKGKSQVGG